MTIETPEPQDAAQQSAPLRRRLPWILGGVTAVVLVAIGATVAAVAAGGSGRVPSASKSASITPSGRESPSPTASPATVPAGCTATMQQSWVLDGRLVQDLPAAPAESAVLTEFDRPAATMPEDRTFTFDAAGPNRVLVGFDLGPHAAGAPVEYSLIDLAKGTLWTTRVPDDQPGVNPRLVRVVATPETTGVPGLVVHVVGDAGDEFRERLIALDEATGDVVHSVDVNAVVRSRAYGEEGAGVLDSRTVGLVYAVRGDALVALDPRTLAVRWSIPLNGEDAGIVRMAGPVLFLGADAYDAANGEPLGWSASRDVRVAGSAILALDESGLSRLDPETGLTCWSASGVGAALATTDGVLVGRGGVVQRLDLADGTVVESFAGTSSSDYSFEAFAGHYAEQTASGWSVFGPESASVRIPGNGPEGFAREVLGYDSGRLYTTGARLEGIDLATGEPTWSFHDSQRMYQVGAGRVWSVEEYYGEEGAWGSDAVYRIRVFG